MVYWDDDTCTFVQQSLRNNGEIDTDVSTMSVRDSLYLYFVKQSRKPKKTKKPFFKLCK